MNNYPKNIFKCETCGTIISTESSSRNCLKCETPMVFLGTDKDKDKFIHKPKDD